MKVLLVSNDPSNAHLFQQSFRALKVQLQIAGDSTEALAALKQDQGLPALVLVDVTGTNAGLEALRAVRSKRKLRNVPLIVLGASRNTKEVRRAYELGANAYVCKSKDNFFDLIADIERFWLRRAELPNYD